MMNNRLAIFNFDNNRLTGLDFDEHVHGGIAQDIRFKGDTIAGAVRVE